ncbi:MAG TPA: hypothetical protein VGL59_06685 [Polyangia bacterium]
MPFIVGTMMIWSSGFWQAPPSTAAANKKPPNTTPNRFEKRDWLFKSDHPSPHPETCAAAYTSVQRVTGTLGPPSVTKRPLVAGHRHQKFD